MSPLLLFSLVSVAAVSIRLARAQFSNITCTSQHAWMTNSRGQNPCLVAAYLSVPCVGETAAVDEALDNPGEYYDGPLFGPDDCSCNTVMYSIVEACQLCQFDSGGGPQAWTAWSRNCTTTQVGSYPMAIQPGTAVPAWAYLDVVKADRFNETAASLAAAANVPESTAVSSSSSTSATITATFSTTSQSPTNTTSSSQPTATGLGVAAGSGSNHADSKGPLVGGIVGGVLGLLLVGALVVYIFLRHRRLAGAAHSAPPDSGSGGHAALSAGGTLSRAGTPGPYGHPAALKERMTSPTDSMVYDPDDPRTFPPQMGMAPIGGSVDGHMREATVASGHSSSLGYRPTAVGSIYRGAPEVSP